MRSGINDLKAFERKHGGSKEEYRKLTKNNSTLLKAVNP